MLDYVVKTTEKYLNTKDKAERKKIGQFFTSADTAVFMADLLNIPQQETLRILDPGAGTGILSAALIARLQSMEPLRSIELTCYENAPETSAVLRSNLEWMKSHCKTPLNFTVSQKNYITSQQMDFNADPDYANHANKYDIVIGNPPYKKIPKDAPEALAMPRVCYGAPNLYFLFMAMSLFNLKSGGEMVYIVPRSWTSGAYFKAFREYILRYGKIEHVHLFESRDKVFDKENVLQETMIVQLKKQRDELKDVTITSSMGNHAFSHIEAITAPYETVVSGRDHYVFLATSDKELAALSKLKKLKNTLLTIGLKMKTGLTVDFRNKESLRDRPEADAVPLFYPQHIKDGVVRFPIQKENEYITQDSKGLIQKNSNYLFVKRFTSKEEPRRLQCGVYLHDAFAQYPVISTQNKINFIDSINGDPLSIETVYGLYAILNSSIYDLYYRILNGSTQVNSTEVDSMPMPSLERIAYMGRCLIGAGDLSVRTCDLIMQEL